MLGATLLIAASGAACMGGIAAAAASTTEWIVTNPRTGLAIDGFDPVAYFTDEAALAGRAESEFRYRGAVWRFRNPGDRAAFIDHPDDYEPRFGGYDAVAIGRGVPTPGNPQIWLVAGHKLYLFYSLETRDQFRSDPRRLSIQADAKWPDVAKVLSQ
jgi:hypothetical protein